MRRPVESDWPYINLNEQKRMCPGQFDLPNEVTYGHVNMAPGMSAADDRFAIARACDDSFCYKAIGTFSTGNTAMVHFKLVAIESMCSSVADLGKDKIVIIVPYFEMRRIFIGALTVLNGGWVKVRVSTANGLQGWEGDVSFFVTTVAAHLKGQVGFVADPRRICISITRQRQFLVVVCNVDCTQVRPDDEDVPEADVNKMGDVEKKAVADQNDFSYFKNHGRLISKSANDIDNNRLLGPQFDQGSHRSLKSKFEELWASLDERCGISKPEAETDSWGDNVTQAGSTATASSQPTPSVITPASNQMVQDSPAPQNVLPGCSSDTALLNLDREIQFEDDFDLLDFDDLKEAHAELASKGAATSLILLIRKEYPQVSLSSNITSTPHVSAQQVVRGKLRDEKVFKPFDAQGPLPPEWYYVEHKQAGEGDKYYLNLALDVWCEERPTDLTNESSPGVRPANQSNPQKPVTQTSPITSTQPKSSSELTWLSIRTGFSCGNERGNYKDAKLQSGASR
ncbi:hypothetical protein BKA61DRAFT_687618 [Leptodontidium sp. MPI-SDFR-AT-0119]|nr:hypothetical protein BKA61DRAFT_687618 [Leptodontidium sp. MPI-SDFR-AT-0119]